MRSHGVVVVLPRGDDAAGIVRVREPVLVQALGAHRVVKALAVGVCDWLPGELKAGCAWRAYAHASSARATNSEPLSTVIASGVPRRLVTTSRTRTTRVAGSDGSTAKARPSRLHVSMRLSTRKRRPVAH